MQPSHAEPAQAKPRFGVTNCTMALETMAAEMGLHTGVWVCSGVRVPSRGYIRVFEYAQAFGSPNGATYRRLDHQTGLSTGFWIPNRSYMQVLESQL